MPGRLPLIYTKYMGLNRWRAIRHFIPKPFAVILRQFRIVMATIESKRDEAAELNTVYTEYGAAGFAPPADTIGSDPTSTYSSPKESSTTITHSKTHSTAHSTTHSTTNSATTTSSPGPSSSSDTSDFKFIELHNGRQVFSLEEDHFLAADFESICPSQNCQTDCLNLTRVFTAHPDDLLGSSDGNPADIPVTLFGICSNLANATESANINGDSRVQSFFPDTLSELNTDVQLITSNLTTCLSTTCEMTRDPSECVDYCRPENLIQSPTAFKFSPGIFECTYRICSNTCGLPYANQDVFGIGVGHSHTSPLPLGWVVPSS